MNMHIVIVCGDRKYANRDFLFAKLDELHEKYHFRDLIEGGATGADALARDWAKLHPEIVHWRIDAEWTDLSQPDAVIRTRGDGTKYDAMAGHRRNAKMLGMAPDLVV